MGIEGYYRWISNEFPIAFCENSFSPSFRDCGISHLLFDLNGLLFRLLPLIVNEDHLFSLLLISIESSIEILGGLPNLATVGLFLDGSAPLAKLALQRSRRARAHASHIRRATVAVANGSPCPISPLHLTVGSELMQRAATKLRSWCRLQLALTSKQAKKGKQHTSFYVSGTDVAGEAEAKIFEFIRGLLPQLPVPHAPEG
jgi:5'-3' exonuclease